MSGDRVVLGLSALAHHPAACIFVEGKLGAAVEEERLNREKDTVAFPYRSIEFVLRQMGLTLSDVDRIAYYWDDHGQLLPALRRTAALVLTHPGSAGRLCAQRMRAVFGPARLRAKLGVLVGGDVSKIPPITYVPHHEAHLAAAWLSAPFVPDCALVVDGRGEYAATSLYAMPSRRGRAATSDDGQPTTAGERPTLLEDIAFPNSIGVFYGAITQRLGYRAISGEYKVMGLASYGEPDGFWSGRVNEMLRLTPDGRYQLDLRFFQPEYCSSADHPWLSDRGVRHLAGDLYNEHGFTTAGRALAFAAQARVEEALLGLARRVIAHGGRRMVVSGGVAMNGCAVGRLRTTRMLAALHVPFAPYDAGACIGAALAVQWSDDSSTVDREALRTPFLGPSYDDDEIEALLAECHWRFERPENVPLAAARDLANGRIVGWFDGRMEFGARALGARSILGDPRDAAMRDRVNHCVKRRDGYRPFAPAVLEEEASKYFDVGESRLMAEVTRALPLASMAAPAIVHVDGTARPQTVPKHWPVASFRALIEAFYELTGVPMLLNTSFNVKDEPIVASPLDALRCFGASGLECLYLGPFRIEKSGGAGR